MRHPFPLRYSIPLVLVITGLAVATVVTWSDLRTQTALIESGTRQQALSLGTRTVSRLEYYLQRDDRDATARDVELLQSEPFLRRARLVDASGRELAATRSVAGAAASANTGEALARATAEARRTRSPQVRIAAADTLIALFPVQLAPLPGELRSSRFGVLSMEFDLAGPRENQRAAIVREAQIIAGVALVLALLSWVYFARTITGRVSRLNAAARRLASGDLDVRAPLTGSDELASLASTFAEMASAIAQRTAALQRDERALRLFRAQIDHVNDAIYVVDPDTLRILDVNERACRLLGYAREELLGLTILDIDTEARAQAERLVQDIRTAEQVRLTRHHRRRDGTTFPVEVDARFVRLERDYFVAICRDITERRLAETAADDSARRFSLLVNSLDGIVWEADARTFRFTFVSAQAERLLGYPVSRWIDEPTFWADHIHPADRERAVNYCVACTARGEAHEFEYRMIAADGREVWLRDLVSVETVEGSASRLRGVMMDITTRKLAEQAASLFRAEVERANDAIEVIDPQTGRFVDVNDRACLDLGYTREELLSLAVPDIDPMSDPSLFESNLARLRESGSIHLEAHHRRKDGSSFPVDIVVRLVMVEKEYLVAVVRDATERKRAEASLRESEARLQLAVRATRLGTWDWDLRGDTVYVSPEWRGQIGVGADDPIDRRTWEERLHPDDRASAMQAVAECVSGRTTDYHAEYRLRHSDGSYRWIFARGEILRDQTGAPYRMVGCHLDVTERRSMEERDREAGLRLRRILDGMFVFVGLVTPDGVLVEVNDAPLQLGSLRREDVLGLPLWDGYWFAGLPDQQALVRDSIQRAARGETVRVDIVGRTARGPLIGDAVFNPLRNDAGRVTHVVASAVDISARKAAEENAARLAAFPQLSPNPVLELTTPAAVTYYNDAASAMAASLGLSTCAEMLPPDAARLVSECLESGLDRRFEQPCRDRILSWSFHPVRARGVVHAYAMDVTEMHQMEAQLRQAQKMEAVGMLAGGIAHDFNNLLMVIHGNVALLQADPGAISQGPELASIGDASRRAADLTRQLLTFSRRQVLQPHALDLQDVVASTARLLRRVLGEHIALEVRSAPGLPAIRADRGMVEQVVMNLAINARDAMPTGGRLVLQTGVRHSGAADRQRPVDVAPGDFVYVSVADDGTGVSPEHLDRIFDPFFTTKGVGQGTGLGLATVQSIAMQHGGWVDVASRVGQGTTFTVHFPATGESVTRAEDGGQAVPTGTEVILVVEDERQVRRVTCSMLRRLGYEVLEAGSGVEALQVYGRHGGRIGLVMTDIVMPGGVSGLELVDRLSETDAGLKVLYTSGYSVELAGHAVTLDEGVNFLQKPFSRDELARAVRSALGRP